MKELEQLKKDFDNKLIDLKYNYAVSLLNLVTDQEYAKILDTYDELFQPICEGSEEYLRQEHVLDKLIKIFTETLENRVIPDEMDKEEIKDYLNSLLKDLDVQCLRDITKTVQAMLELK